MKPTSQRPSDDDGDKIPPALISLLRLAGLGLPKTKAEVAAAEKWLAENPVKLPASLTDPEAVFRRPAAAVLRFPDQAQPTSAAEHLARAARDGEEIPPDVEQRMREDREKAERDRKPRQE